MTQTTRLLSGFADPTGQSQAMFRCALLALSEPGTIVSAGGCHGPEGLAPATWALCLTLLDADTPLWISADLDTPSLRANLAFHCACPIVETREAADFALLSANDVGELQAFNTGTDRDPHEACTLIVQMDSIDGGVPATWRGPGIDGSRVVRLPLPQAFWQGRDACGFPRGLDAFFAAGGDLVGLPRSTRVLHAVHKQEQEGN